MAEATLTPRERLEGAAARMLGALPPRVQRRLAGGEPVRIDGQELDPGIQLTLRVLAQQGLDSVISGPKAEPGEERTRVRQQALGLVGTPTQVGAVHDLDVGGAAGSLRARHYTPPEATEPVPLLVLLHGGGWVIGDLDTYDEPCRLLCRHAGVQVLSVDYRLAPEHPFPAPLDDAVAAWRWAHDNAGELGADPDRVAIGGDSAGGNLSAVASQVLAAEDGPAPALQVLIYPATDFAERSRSSELFGSGFLLTNGDRDWFERHYFRATTDADAADPRLSPLRAPDLSGLPPAIVVTAGFDPLRDEGEAYAAALLAAGNSVVLHRVRALVHGFVSLTSINRASHDATVMLAGMIHAQLAARAPVPASAA